MAQGHNAGAAWDAERVTLGRHFLRDMESLWGEILRLAATVETSVNASARALCDGRGDLAEEVAGDEREIDRREVAIERHCLRLLALHQPVASDLRRVAAVLKINNDLERMGDLAAHIARRSRKFARVSQLLAIPPRLETLAIEVIAQVRDCLDALARSDAALARSVIAGDRRVDRLRRDLVKELKQAIRNDPDRLNTWLRLINTGRNLERIADHATNIAEAVIYLKEGTIIRHHVGDRWVAERA